MQFILNWVFFTWVGEPPASHLPIDFQSFCCQFHKSPQQKSPQKNGRDWHCGGTLAFLKIGGKRGTWMPQEVCKRLAMGYDLFVQYGIYWGYFTR